MEIRVIRTDDVHPRQGPSFASYTAFVDISATRTLRLEDWTPEAEEAVKARARAAAAAKIRDLAEKEDPS